MKTGRTIFSAAIAAIIAVVAIPQLASAKVPSEMQDFTSHGIHVILRQSNANKVIAVALNIKGGLAYGETDDASIAPAVAGLITASGSDKYPKEKYRNELARLSTDISGSGNLYGMTFSLRTIRPNFDDAWDIFASVLVRPQYDNVEAEKFREQSIQGIMSRSSDPEGYTGFLLDSLWKGSSVLNRVPSIDEIKNMTLDQIKDYRNSAFQRARMTMVIVGNVSKAEIEAKLAQLDRIPLGTAVTKAAPTIAPQLSDFLYVPRELPTTYVEARFPSANVMQSDWWPERVLLGLLDKQLFDQVRTKRNLAYAPGAWATGDHSNFYGAISYQSVLPDSAARVVFRVLRGLQENLVPKHQVDNAKRARITTYFFGTQSNERQAAALLSDQVEFGDWRLFFDIVPKTETVTPEQVRDMAKKYFHDLTFVVMGPEGKSTKATYNFR